MRPERGRPAEPSYEGLGDLLIVETSRSRRYGTPLSLLVASVSHGRDESEGYTSCDEQLDRFHRLVAGNVRATDSVTVTEDREIALLLPGIGKTRAFLVAERLREILSAVPDRPSLAVGVATLGGRIETGEDLRSAAGGAMREAAAGDGDITRIAGNRGE